MTRALNGRREQLAKTGVELFYLPPRSPELNDFEHVWGTAKHEDYPRRTQTSLDAAYEAADRATVRQRDRIRRPMPDLTQALQFKPSATPAPMKDRGRPKVAITQRNHTTTLDHQEGFRHTHSGGTVGVPAEGTYLIKHKTSGLYMTVSEGSTANSAHIEQRELKERWGSQLWRLSRAGDGYHLRNLHSGLYLHVSSHSTSNSALVEQWPMWEETGPLSVKADPNSVSSGSWRLKEGPEAGTYALENRQSGLYLNVRGYSREPGELLEQYNDPAKGAAGFAWWSFEPTPALPEDHTTISYQAIAQRLELDSYGDDTGDKTIEVYGSVKVTYKDRTTALVDTNETTSVELFTIGLEATTSMEGRSVDVPVKKDATAIYWGPGKSAGDRSPIGVALGDVAFGDDEAFTLDVRLKDSDPPLERDDDVAKGTLTLTPDDTTASADAFQEKKEDLEGDGTPKLVYTFHPTPPYLVKWELGRNNASIAAAGVPVALAALRDDLRLEQRYEDAVRDLAQAAQAYKTATEANAQNTAGTEQAQEAYREARHRLAQAQHEYMP
ncbi:RICIN domain-containing protein [Streptomyces natalensis]|uniref:RICIN domain-containing protein n=1 Tax=Streptomyces natalensis TaxID=68242 RepID=UPI0012FF0EB4|nr:RICIN domain-containing protein [Streptomyces natalensis]